MLCAWQAHVTQGLTLAKNRFEINAEKVCLKNHEEPRGGGSNRPTVQGVGVPGGRRSRWSTVHGNKLKLDVCAHYLPTNGPGGSTVQGVVGPRDRGLSLIHI